MFERFGNLAARHWVAIIVGWAVVFLGTLLAAPSWDSVVEDGEFKYLPDGMQSRTAQIVFEQAFNRDLLGCSIVVIVARDGRRDGKLDDGDRAFIDNTLKPALEEITREYGGFEPMGNGAEGSADDPAARPLVLRVRTESDPEIGHLLKSRDDQASLVMIELTTEFMEQRNKTVIDEIEKLLERLDPAYEPLKKRRSLFPAIWEKILAIAGVEHGDDAAEPSDSSVAAGSGAIDSKGLDSAAVDNAKSAAPAKMPAGLSLKLSGSAAVGRDMIAAEKQSADATEGWTLILVVALLLLIYRAPVLAFIPLVTVAASVSIALSLLSLLAQADVVDLFSGIEVYVTVVLYGAGVDFCVFLMARYKEELDAGSSYEEAISKAVSKVGAAIAASAGTTMCGIGMMYFAEFGKFRQAGIAMSSSLLFVLIGSLTLAPALLRLAGGRAFWPNVSNEWVSAAGWLSPTSLLHKLMEQNWFTGVWDKIGNAILRRPMTIWLTCILLMMPFAVFGGANFDFLSYGLLSELPDENPSVQGAQKVQEHFPAGETAPITALLVDRNVDFSDRETGIEAIRQLTLRLEERKDELGIGDIRSVSDPLGLTGLTYEELIKDAADKLVEERGLARWVAMGTAKKGVTDKVMYYVSDKDQLANHVTRIDFILKNDPFSRESMDRFDRLKVALTEEIERSDDFSKSGESPYELHYVGATSSIRDLKSVTNRDQIFVDSLVVLSVFLVLVVLLRRIALCSYLILSVLFSYFVTLGATFALFWSLDPAGFAGLDWKVPMFLFTILVAVGEDYNIYLITRIEEEQRNYGPVRGVTVALSRTGGIISSCGIIMAGTFASLTSGTLEGMIQLGFALAFGVLLDTFVVRPILVPSYLVLLHSGRFGVFGKILGAQHEVLARELAAELQVSGDRTDASSR